MGCGETDVESAGVLFEEVTRGCSGRRNALRLYEALCIDIIAGKCRDAMHRVSTRIFLFQLFHYLLNRSIQLRILIFQTIGEAGLYIDIG